MCGSEGPLDLLVQLVVAGNDNFADRHPVSLSVGSVTYELGSNIGATVEEGEEVFDANGVSSVWYTFTAPASAVLTTYFSGSVFNPLMSLYEDTDGTLRWEFGICGFEKYSHSVVMVVLCVVVCCTSGLVLVGSAELPCPVQRFSCLALRVGPSI